MSFLRPFIHLHEITDLATLEGQPRADGFHFVAKRIDDRERLLLDAEYYIERTIYEKKGATNSRLPNGAVGLAHKTGDVPAITRFGLNPIMFADDRCFFRTTNFLFYNQSVVASMISDADLSPALEHFLKQHKPKPAAPPESPLHRAVRARPGQIGLFIPAL